ncbi:MAG TPA: hypothetical protein PLV68_05075 [Ilumatobacteraceae bacterium]|nr:hypothetical protein [Ilumatobacteraceae bacterium]
MTRLGINSFDATATAGRKGLPYDWQSLLAAEGVAEIEAELSELVLEPSE